MGSKRLERFIRASFYSYGGLVSRRPMPFLLAPLLLTFILSFGFLFYDVDTDIVSLFTLPNAPSRREVATMRRFSRAGSAVWSEEETGNDDDYTDSRNKSMDSHREYRYFDVYVTNPYEANLFDVRVFDEIADILHYVYWNFSCSVSEKNEIKTYHYSPDFCDQRSGCQHLDVAVETLRKFLSPHYKNNPNIQLTYPAMKIYGNSIVWADLLRGVTVRPNNTVSEFKSLVIPLQFRFDNRIVTLDHVHQCMHQLAEFFWDLHRPAFALEFYVMYEQLFVEEIQKTQLYSLPWISLTVVLIALFCTLSTYEGGRFFSAQSTEAGFGLFTIGLSLVAGFGSLFFAQCSYNFVVSTTPFVVLCVSIDNDFLLLAAWRRTNPRCSREERISATFCEAGPSLTITSLTDVLCFAIGCVSGVPAVATFCLFTAVTLSFRFVFQFTFFAAIMALGSNETKLAQICCCSDAQKKIRPDLQEYSEHFMHKFFRLFWTRLLMKRWIRLILSLFYIFYVVCSLVLVFKLVINITPARVVAEDSKIIPVFANKDKYGATSSLIGHIFVLNPPDFRNRTNRKIVASLVNKLQSTKYYSPSTSYTSIWLFDYANYYAYVSSSGSPLDSLSSNSDVMNNSSSSSSINISYSATNDEIGEKSASGTEYDDPDFYDYIGDFLKVFQYKQYAGDIHLKKSRRSNMEDSHGLTGPNIESFQFRMYFRNVSSWERHVELMLNWRRVCALFPELDAMVIDRNNLNPYMDERMSVGPTTMQTTGIALLCMALVTGLLMPDITGIFYITLSFLSVDIGVVGLLNLWGCDLDLTTMAGILMTIGFSVYYTARICYSYQTSDGAGIDHDDPEAKLAATLGAVGWPVLQGGIGTVLGILPLSFVRCYVTRTFFKTIVLVVICGLFHGLIVMPLMMTSLDSNKRKRFRKVLHK